MPSYVSVAPMMDWTDRHCRFFHRLLSPSAHLYTEMITTNAILYGNADRHLRYDRFEQPVALQLGGSFPESLGKCARIGENYDYDEINLNCGCPSDRVQQGKFGACLMNEPYLVAACVDAMKAVTDLPVTVKCRIGLDDSDDEFEFTKKFMSEVSRAGCQKFIIHARKAWLKGLSPKENREKPPLRYDIVEKLKQEFPGFFIVVNGGITTIDAALEQLERVDGVMIGREAYQNPYILAELHHRLHGGDLPTREEIALRMVSYIDAQRQNNNVTPKSIIRHMLGLFNGQKGARAWRRYLSENMARFGVDGRVVEEAIAAREASAAQTGSEDQ